MKKLIMQIIIDVVLYSLIYLTIFKDNEIAENLLSFFVVAIGIMVTIASFALGNDGLKDIVNKTREQGGFSLYIRYYCRASTILEVSIFASQGWYWMASLWFICFLYHLRIHALHDEMYGKPKLI